MELDNSVVNLIKAISKVESGGNINAVGASGEGGSYQFLPSTWNESAKKYGINVPLEQATAGQQNAVAYNLVKEWKDKGYNVTQIASMWNAGSGRPNAFKENWKGVNSSGVAYDTPAYVAKVAEAYVGIKNSSVAPQVTKDEYIQDPNNPNASIKKQEEINTTDRYVTGEDGYTIKNPNYDPNAKENIGFVQSIAQDIAQPFIRQGATGFKLLASVPHIISAISAYKSGDQAKFLEEVKLADTSKIEEDVVNAGVLGKVSPTLDTKETVGDVMQIASWFVPVSKVATAGKIATTATKPGVIAAEKALETASKETILQSAKKSLPLFAQGFTYSAGDTLSDGGSVQDAIKNGIITGTVTAGIGTAISTISNKISSKTVNAIQNKIDTKIDAKIDTLWNADGTRIISPKTDAIWNNIKEGIGGAAKTAMKDLIDSSKISGINIYDAVLFAVSPHLGILSGGLKTANAASKPVIKFLSSPYGTEWYVKALRKVIEPNILSKGLETPLVKKITKMSITLATDEIVDTLEKILNKPEEIKEVKQPNLKVEQ